MANLNYKRKNNSLKYEIIDFLLTVLILIAVVTVTLISQSPVGDLKDVLNYIVNWVTGNYVLVVASIVVLIFLFTVKRLVKKIRYRGN